MDGIAIAQGVALFNWLQRLVTAEGQLAQQVEYVPASIDPVLNEVIPASIRTIDPVASLSYLAGVSGLTVTGHSLGGHLAMMMSRLAPGVVSEVYTYNAPGFDVFGTGLTSTGFFDLLRTAAIDPVTGPIGTGWDGDSMVHLDVQGDEIHDLGFTPGSAEHLFTVFSESADQGIVDAHLKEPIVDGLALSSLFAQLDPLASTHKL